MGVLLLRLLVLHRQLLLVVFERSHLVLPRGVTDTWRERKKANEGERVA